MKQWSGRDPIGSALQPLWLRCKFYVGKGVEPDLANAINGLQDLMQEARILANDRWIKSVDGCRVIPWREHKQEPWTDIEILNYEEND